MAYNTKPIITDVDGNPISQYYNKALDQFEPVEGSKGANKVLVENNDLSLIPILEKLSQLTGTVIDEETRKSNELERIDNEDTRQSNEDTRNTNEIARVEDENTRIQNENTRVQNENIRKTNEQNRVDLYNDLMEKVSTGYFDGKNLEFHWNGTSLGVRVEGETEYIYVDLKGETGDIENLTMQHVINALGYTPVKSVNNTVADEAGNIELDIDTSEIENRIGNVENDLDAHKAEKVYQGELHGFRLQEGKLEYFDGQEWKRVRGDGYPVGNISNFNTKSGDKQITLSWQDPDDVTITDSNDNVITIARWKGTKILRKTGSYPPNENDGVLVVDNGIKNQYSENGFTDVGLQNDVEYFYMAFPYTEEDVYTVDENNRVSATPTEIKIYGVEIDESNSNPETAVVYTDDAVGFTPASGNNGAFNWGSWEDIIKDEFKIRPCVLNNPQKTVNYYLDYDDYTKKATGGASVLTGADGDVMVEFGTDIYTKWTVVGSKHKIQFSIKPFEGATKNVFEVESGYNQFAYYPLLLTQKLFQLLFKNRDSQTALGRGYVDGNSDYATTGNTNTKGFMFGETTGKQQMKFLGIEDYWGNRYQWIDGLVTDASFNILIGNSNFNDTGSGYTSHASGISANTAGYIDTVQGGNDKGFIIKGKSGSETTHYCDYGDLYSSRVAYFGGHLSYGSNAGFAYLRLSSSASCAGAVIGSRLFCKNNGKLYIGAYLGTTQGGKLRSVSGTTSASNKTISVFRTEAQANNN